MTFIATLKNSFLTKKNITFYAFLLIAIALGARTYFNNCNNFLIFKYTWFHLLSHQSMYLDGTMYNPQTYYDHNHYGPSFGILFAPFSLLPLKLSQILWVAFNTFTLWLAIYKLPLSRNQQIFIAWFIVQELITSLTNVQVNSTIAAFMVMAFVCLENKQLFFAAFFMCIGSFKFYTLCCAGLFLFYPDKIKFMAYFLFWFVVINCLPLLVVSPQQLYFQYHEWLSRLSIKTEKESAGIAIGGFMSKACHIYLENKIWLVIGLFLYSFIYLKYKWFSNGTFRILVLANLLLWVIIFGLSSESATYIIAVTGCGIWVALQKKINSLDSILIILLVIFTMFSYSDLFPKSLFHSFIDPYAIKAVPVILIWSRIMYQILFFEKYETTFTPINTL